LIPSKQKQALGEIEANKKGGIQHIAPLHCKAQNEWFGFCGKQLRFHEIDSEGRVFA